MEINVPIEELRKRKLMVCTPMYGGNCTAIYSRSMADLSMLCTHYGIELKVYALSNESLITRARNYSADEFMRSDCTHLMFIDADIGFDARDVIAMLAIQSPEADDEFDILAGPYPKKCISWEKIKIAVDKGIADEDPSVLDRYVGDYVINPVASNLTFNLNDPVEIMEAGTGFMMIRRNTFEKFSEAYPQQHYLPDHVRTEHFDGTREIVAFFDTPIDHKRTNILEELEHFFKKNPNAKPKEVVDFIRDPNNGYKDYSKRYLSEDYMFCQWTRKIGMKVWLCPWMRLQHSGTMIFGGSLGDVLSIGASATADVSSLKKKK